MSVEDLLGIAVRRYTDEYIHYLDLSEKTKNNLKRQLRKIFLDEDFIYDLENNVKRMCK